MEMDFSFSLALERTRIKPDDGLIAPYGGELVQAFVPAETRGELIPHLSRLPRLSLSQAELHDLEMLACGAYSPLDGYMDHTTYESVCADGVLPNGLAWGLPITLAASPEQACALDLGQWVALYFDNQPVAVLQIRDVFPWEPRVEIAKVYESMETKHPGFTERMRRGTTYLIAGPIALIATRTAPYLLPNHLWPREVRNAYAARDWRRLSAVHLWNPWHRVHEYQLKCALEASDALLLHTLVDRPDDHTTLPAHAVAEACRLLLKHYFPEQRVILNPLPRCLFLPGTRAAVQHAILSQNYGCENIFLIAPSDNPGDLNKLQTTYTHAAVGLAIRPTYLEPAFHCETCGGVATDKSCPHDDASRIVLTEMEILEKLLNGEHLPPMITRPEVARALAQGVSTKTASLAFKRNGKHVFPHAAEVSQDLRQLLSGHKAGVLWMTGLSGSGKSTIAHRIQRDLLLNGHGVYVLDGDTLRHGLNRDLGFSDACRRENLRRAAEVAKVLMDAGLIVIASFISPFKAEREMVREIVGKNFHEIHIEASLEDCEARDPKGLYRRARAGVIPQFTGISSPYEPPENPDLCLNTSRLTVEQCLRQLHEFLALAGVLRAGTKTQPLAESQISTNRTSINLQ